MIDLSCKVLHSHTRVSHMPPSSLSRTPLALDAFRKVYQMPSVVSDEFCVQSTRHKDCQSAH